ncbi:DNA protein crosslink repair co-factor UBX5 KNAG_0C05370 [Huiozyma naganishii CBS 8797]|uniref:UBX domain-containing protein n=1 Tax=Huiozyma naganishii (strain ATCC MYA-139 / BCRC 22969 / CBS 8797 / KCTC 17520 / NBRC 10181 / NCYC 3082 / Yp74L-3) TaxID=1071383 RepID=J7R463_HUIN7|nr:hypothetical protein KNAG_0C05370 [Kazachstania naganishii CBS 8797]CCK69635.1 hypothetical protein KNAG_0C05370 [Kazachstania naganishii CBS 8797]
MDEFKAVTACYDDAVVERYLELSGGDAERAIGLYFETQGQLGGVGEPSEEHLETPVEEEVRPPMEGTRGPLVDMSGPFGHVERVTGPLHDTSRPTGVFNQAAQEDAESMEDRDGDSSEYEYVEETVVDMGDDGPVREYTKMVRRPRQFTKEQRLARLFRPPFSIITTCGLEEARSIAQREGKWVMLNVQDNAIFQCQVVNRDLWSSPRLKALIRDKFVFLQYLVRSPQAEPYLNFYGVGDLEHDLPHVAILDPVTGERVKKWDNITPDPDRLVQELEQFLEQFSLDPAAVNPTVDHPVPKLDPATLTEEQQMELAIRESLGPAATSPSPVTEEPAVTSISPEAHEEPAPGPNTTRIQIRTGDGRRIVHRFNTDRDTVRTVYALVKHEWEDCRSVPFTLRGPQRNNLETLLDCTIGEAHLANSLPPTRTGVPVTNYVPTTYSL